MIPKNFYEVCQNICHCWPCSYHSGCSRCSRWKKLTKEEQRKIDKTTSAMAHHAMTGD